MRTRSVLLRRARKTPPNDRDVAADPAPKTLLSTLARARALNSDEIQTKLTGLVRAKCMVELATASNSVPGVNGGRKVNDALYAACGEHCQLPDFHTRGLPV